MSPLKCYCSICRTEMKWEDRYGRESCCCSRDCWQEFDWRLTLSILNKPYRPDPKRLSDAEAKVLTNEYEKISTPNQGTDARGDEK